MRIRGIWGDESHRLHPDQWVNVYEVDVLGGCVFCCSCQVREFQQAFGDEADCYGLEPCDIDGNLVSVKSALQQLEGSPT